MLFSLSVPSAKRIAQHAQVLNTVLAAAGSRDIGNVASYAGKPIVPKEHGQLDRLTEDIIRLVQQDPTAEAILGLSPVDGMG
jgi:hypothetical protein